MRSVVGVIVDTLDHIQATQESIVDQVLTLLIRTKSPFVFFGTKIVLIYLIAFVFFTTVYLIYCIALVIEDIVKSNRRRRELKKKRKTLIPTFYNARTLSDRINESPFLGLSYQSLPPPPEVHRPTAPPDFDLENNCVKQPLQTFKHE